MHDISNIRKSYIGLLETFAEDREISKERSSKDARKTRRKTSGKLTKNSFGTFLRRDSADWKNLVHV